MKCEIHDTQMMLIDSSSFEPFYVCARCHFEEKPAQVGQSGSVRGYIAKCPFCGMPVEERVKGLTYQVEHKNGCIILEFIASTYLAYTDSDSDRVQIIQLYELGAWNKRAI